MNIKIVLMLVVVSLLQQHWDYDQYDPLFCHLNNVLSCSSNILLVVQMKFGEICEQLQPSGDINAFMVKKELMSSIFGKFFVIKVAN